jgi:digalactosyldiacylglycerol synthase
LPRVRLRRDSDEFSQCLSTALSHDPKPLSQQELHSLTWEAATERFLDIADAPPGGAKPHPLAAPLEASFDTVLHALHNTMTGVEFLRVAMGAGAKTRDAPARVTDYVPDENDVGGFFDDSSRAKTSWDERAKRARASKGGEGDGKAGREAAAAPVTVPVTASAGGHSKA